MSKSKPRTVSFIGDVDDVPVVNEVDAPQPLFAKESLENFVFKPIKNKKSKRQHSLSCSAASGLLPNSFDDVELRSKDDTHKHISISRLPFGKNSRKSRMGMKEHKKGGGGKGIWNKNDVEFDDLEVDKRDPCYDSDNDSVSFEVTTPVLTEDKFDELFTNWIKEYFENAQANEVLFLPIMGKANTGKRTRLSGAQLMKKRNAKKAFIESQKGSIFKFLPKQNELRGSDEESELSNNSVSNEVTIRKNILSSESNLSNVDCNMLCSSAEVSQSQFIPQIFSTNDEIDDIDVIEMAGAQAVQEIEDSTYEHGNASLNLTKLDSDIMEDPGKWPDINDNLRCFLIQYDPKRSLVFQKIKVDDLFLITTIRANWLTEKL